MCWRTVRVPGFWQTCSGVVSVALRISFKTINQGLNNSLPTLHAEVIICLTPPAGRYRCCCWGPDAEALCTECRE